MSKRPNGKVSAMEAGKVSDDEDLQDPSLDEDIEHAMYITILNMQGCVQEYLHCTGNQIVDPYSPLRNTEEKHCQALAVFM